jgi:hypothetical protein
MKKSIAMSRTPDRRAALAPRFRLMEPAPAVGLAQPITLPQPRAGRANLRPPAAFNPSHLSGPKAFILCMVRNGPPSQPRDPNVSPRNRHMNRRAPPSEMAGLSCF